MGPSPWKNSTADAAPVAALFPPQSRDWALPAEANLTPHAAERVCRESAQKAFEEAARSLNYDWHTQLDGKQLQRWAEAFGRRAVQVRDAEVRACKQGRRPASPANEPQLLVVGVDGGRWQGREKDPETESRWREDKVGTVTSYVPGDGSEEHPPQKLLTTHVATTRNAEAFGAMIRLEAERRGIRQAQAVTLMGDCANWIDPLHEKHFPCHPRIADYEHAVEHLWDAARAAVGADDPKAPKLAGRLETLLYGGKVKLVVQVLREHLAALGEPTDSDGEQHPRKVLAREIGYFERNQPHMNYPEYRAKGWPIGSGNTEAGVKQFNKRVKGTEQFWSERGVESMLALRALWLSQDQRWDRHWASRPAYGTAA